MWRKKVAVGLVLCSFCQPVFASPGMSVDELNQLIESTRKDIEELRLSNEVKKPVIEERKKESVAPKEDNDGKKQETEKVIAVKKEVVPQDNQVKVVLDVKGKVKTEEVIKAPIVQELPVQVVVPETKVEVVVDNRPKYNLNYQNVNLKDVLLLIAQKAERRITVDSGIKTVISISLNDVTFDDALNILALNYGFNWMIEEKTNTVMVAPADSMIQNKRFVVKFANTKFVKDEIIGLGVKENAISLNSEYNAISVTATPYLLTMIEKRLVEIDKPVAQCLIVAKLMEITKSNDGNFGINYSLPNYSHAAASGDSATGIAFGLKDMSYGFGLSANQTKGNGNVVSKPTIMAQNGQEAVLTMSERVPILTTTATTGSTQITVSYEEIGNILKVTPVMNPDDKSISLTVDVKASNISKWTTSGGVSAPQITTRQASTKARVKSGQTMVIGGLMNSSDMDNLSGIPGLMNLPILGKLFQYHTKSKNDTEVVIMITPYYLDENSNVESLVKK